MKDFMSTRWIRVVGLVAWISIVWAMFGIHDFPWTGLVWASLALSTALWVRMRSNRSISQVIDDIEAEPVRAVAMPGRVAIPVRKAVR
jgi:hypothetical protein